MALATAENHLAEEAEVLLEDRVDSFVAEEAHYIAYSFLDYLWKMKTVVVVGMEATNFSTWLPIQLLSLVSRSK